MPYPTNKFTARGSELKQIDVDVCSRSLSAWFTVTLIIEVFAVAAFQSPLVRLDRFAIFDSGGELAIHNLIDRGYRPTIDFGYLYGLLPLFIGRLWYRAVGLSPIAFRIQGLACMVLTAWGMARFASNRRVGPVGYVLIAAVIPDLLLVSYIGLVQSLEQVLLINALAEHARIRRGSALALVTACCFVKPALAVVQGFTLVVVIAATAWRVGFRRASCSFIPLSITVATISTVLIANFGIIPLRRTILPRTGMAVYRLGGFGFFHGIGRDFWALPHAQLRDYFRYELGFWTLGTMFLIWGALRAIWRVLQRRSTIDQRNNDEICLACAATHIGFVLLIFGHRGTWFYSLPMLILGLTLLADHGLWHRRLLWALVMLVLISDRSKAVDMLHHWKADSPNALSLNLWADPQEQAEWTRALQLTRGKQPVLLAMCDGGALLLPGFVPPAVGYFVPGNALDAEVQRKAAQLKAATMIISAHSAEWIGFTLWPEIKVAFEGCELVQKGKYLRVYHRIVPCKNALGQPDK